MESCPTVPVRSESEMERLDHFPRAWPIRRSDSGLSGAHSESVHLCACARRSAWNPPHLLSLEMDTENPLLGVFPPLSFFIWPVECLS